MKIKVNSRIGQTAFQFEIEEKNEMETLHKAIVLSNFPKYCHVCKNKEIFKIDSNKDKEGNTYVKVICGCGAQAKLGQYKTGGYFWHRFEMYQKKEEKKEVPKPMKDAFPESEVIDNDDPFFEGENNE